MIKIKNLPFIIHSCDEIIKESLEGLERVRDIVANLKSFSHTDEAEVQEENVNHRIDVTIKMIWNELKYKCKVIKDYEELPLLRCFIFLIIMSIVQLFTKFTSGVTSCPCNY